MSSNTPDALAPGFPPVRPRRPAAARPRPSSPIGAPALERLARRIATVMPGILIAWSALIDPLINFDVAAGEYFGGVSIGAESKSRWVTQLAMPMFFALSLSLALVARPVVPRRMLRVVAPAVLLLVLACMSAAWARVPSTTLTLAVYQIILCAALFLFTTVAANSQRVLNAVLVVFAVVIAANLAAVVIRPTGEIGHQGIYEYKNTLGSAGACAFLFGLFHLRARSILLRALAWFTVVGAMVVVLASDSKTALALMVVAPVFAGLFHVFSGTLGLRPIPAALLFSLLATCAVVVMLAVLGADTDDMLVATYGDATFTGRTHIWLFAMDYIRDTPWLGQGYRGFWSIDGSPKHGSEIEFIRTIGSGHNGFIDITLSIGLAGLTLLTLFILAVFKMAGRLDMRATSRTLLFVSMVVFVIGRNLMESVILWSTFFDNLSFLLVAFLACYRETPARRSVRRA